MSPDHLESTKSTYDKFVTGVTIKATGGPKLDDSTGMGEYTQSVQKAIQLTRVHQLLSSL